jgi:uncharacterized protein YdiU (UPF0061 family)
LPGRRYAFGNQAGVAYWNLGKLANAFAFLVPDTDQLVAVLNTYQDVYEEKYYNMMASKLGLDQVREGDRALIDSFQEMLQLLQPDMTLFYQLLIDLPVAIASPEEVHDFFRSSFYTEGNTDSLYYCIEKYQYRMKLNSCSKEFSQNKMRAANPRFILRNYILHEVIEQLEKGDDQLLKKVMRFMKTPYSNAGDEYLVKRPNWAAQKAGCSMLSCSS